MDKFRIDSHKLIYHVDKVYQWIKGEDIYPVYMEIAPCGGCNHRCKFCALDYLGYKPDCLKTETLINFLKEIASCGVKSVMFAGEGEPLLHKDIAKLVISARKMGLDVSITTNGVLLTKELLEQILPHLSWLRISFNAGTAKTYSLIHRTDPKDFERVIKNIKEGVHIKKKNNYACTIGIQFLLLNENYSEVSGLAEILKHKEVDYLIVKPYSQHPLSINRLKSQLDYKKLLSLEKDLDKYATENFHVIFRRNTMMKIPKSKPYKKCFGIPFWAYLSSQGDLYACSTFLSDKRFCYGNIYRSSFKDLWKSKKRKKIMQMMKDNWDIENCREVCRLDEINRYLWELKNPPLHVNFI